MNLKELEDIWPVGWSHTIGAQHFSATVQGERIEVYPRTGNVVFPHRGSGMPGITLREKLQAARAEVLRLVRPVPDITPEPSMEDRLAAILYPLGWSRPDRAFRYPCVPWGMWLLNYDHLGGILELRLSDISKAGRKVYLPPHATDAEVHSALTELLDFPRWP